MPSHAAGFWLRWSATWIDAAIVYAGAMGLVSLSAGRGRYLPFEVTLLILWLGYSVILVASKGRTVGKAWCGLSVQARGGGRVGFARACVRELIGKLVSGVCLLLGFMWVAISKEKRAWHDHIARTSVVRGVTVGGRVNLGIGAGVAISLAVIGPMAAETAYSLALYARMNVACAKTAVASGYVFLCTRRELATCQWLDGYVSEEMFVSNKPFYEGLGRRAGRRVLNAGQTNELLRR